MEKQLICPLNVIGKVDLMITNNHGSDTSTPSELVQSVRPTAVVVNNGSRKGGDPLVLDRVAAVMGRDAIWQVHFSTRAAEKNAPLEHIANIEGGPDVGNTLTVSVTKAGDLTFTNPRTGTSKTYPKAR
jgi:hypothetical protein